MASGTIEPVEIYLSWPSFMLLGEHTVLSVAFHPLSVSNMTPVATDLALVGVLSLVLKAENSVQQPNKSNGI